MSSCCCGARLIYKAVCSCSGASDTGCISDRAARQIAAEKIANMTCTAAIAARVEDVLNWTVNAQHVIVIDGCDKDCAKRILEERGFTDLVHVRVTDLGMEKGKTPVTEENTQKVVARVKSLLGK